ncbi:MAG: M23 family metallopeptidase [Verrucomicrobiota bacterium JB022]|nr:M23 family metallopeptidase [Verrucomicrobiota bacterium JB022]
MRMYPIFFLFLAAALGAETLRLPFEGRWFVYQGGDTPNVNHHMAVRAQWYGIDFVKTGGQGGRALTQGEGRRLEDFYSWGEPVLAPLAGEVVAVVNDLPDHPLGEKDAAQPAGNHVVIRTAAGHYLFLGHLQEGSVAVEPGAQVEVGDMLGKVGNSGHSDFPHLHLHLQTEPALNQGLGLNLTFAGIDVELTGKRFTNVEWPLIRGLFVSPTGAE